MRSNCLSQVTVNVKCKKLNPPERPTWMARIDSQCGIGVARIECIVCTANVLIGRLEWRTNNYSVARSILWNIHSIEGVIRDPIQALYITRIFRVFVLILLHDSTMIWSLFVHAHTLHRAHDSYLILFMHILLLFVRWLPSIHQYTIEMHIYLPITERTNVLYREKSRCGYRRRRLGRFY